MWTIQTGKKKDVFEWCPLASEHAYTGIHCTHPGKQVGRKFRCDCNKVERATQPPKGCPLLTDSLIKTISWDSQ